MIPVRNTTYYTRRVAEIAGRLDSSRWELGDELLEAYRDLGADEYAHVVEGSGLSLSACSQARWVAHAYTKDERGYPFSWSVYRALAAVPKASRTTLLVALTESGKTVTVQEAELLADLAKTMTPDEVAGAVADLGEAASPSAIETALGRVSEDAPYSEPQTRIEYVLGRIIDRFPWARGSRWQTVLRAALEIAEEWQEPIPVDAPSWFKETA